MTKLQPVRVMMSVVVTFSGPVVGQMELTIGWPLLPVPLLTVVYRLMRMLPPSAMYSTERLLSKLIDVTLANCAVPMPYIPSSSACVGELEPARLTTLLFVQPALLPPVNVMRQALMTVPAGGPVVTVGTLSAMYIQPVDVSMAAAVGHSTSGPELPGPGT